MRLVLSNHWGRMDATGRRTHLLRDYSGANIPGNILYPPVEMLYAASYLRARGHEVALVDGNARHLSTREAVAEIAALAPDCVATVSSWFSLEHDLELLRQAKAATPGCVTVMAGPNVTLDPASALGPGGADVVALGEFMVGLDAVLSGRMDAGVAWQDGASLTVYPDRPVDPLDRVPFAAWDLVDPARYWVPFARRRPFALARTGAGCPHGRCRFCHAVSYFGEGHRSHSAEYVVQEMDRLISLGFGEVIYRDQCFTARREVVEALCRHLIDRGAPVTWRASTRVDHVDAELLQLMARAGCYQLSFGFESFSDDALSWCDKGATAEQGRRAARWARAAGLELSGGFVVGIPGERGLSPAQVRRQIRALGIDFPQFFTLTHVFDREGERFVALHRPGDAAPARDRRRMRRIALGFYLDPRYALRQARRVASARGLREVPGFFLDFLRYFV